MDAFLFEHFWKIGLVGSVLTGLTIYGWVQTGQKYALWAAIGLLALTLLLVGLNLWVVTDRETIREQLGQMATMMQENDFAKVRTYIHPHPSTRVINYSQQLDLVKFTEFRIASIHAVDVKPMRGNKRATARLNIVLHGEIRALKGKALRWVELTLEQVGEKWMILDFDDREPQHEFINRALRN